MKKIFTFIFIATSFYAQAQTYSSTGSVAIPDGPSSCGIFGTDALSTISVPLIGTITTPVDVTINVRIDIGYIGDIDIELVAPDATSCFLLNHIGAVGCGGSGVELISTNTLSFNSAHTTPIPTTATPVPAGNYAPTGSVAYPSACDLATFLSGKSVLGNWSLRGRDNWAGFVGTVSSWDMVFGSTALPIDLISFTGATYTGYNALRWESGLEQNTATIILERSTNGKGFQKISSFLPQGNYSKYAYNDITDFSVMALYRLKIIEVGGQINYSPVLKLVSSFVKTNISSTAPNPVTKNVILLTGDESLVGTTAQLVNAMGQTVQQITIKSLNHTIDMSEYSKGVYMLKLANGDILKFIKTD